ncbi:hypothetical protein FB45DRAFT_1081922 [Roridomyces roridus]|uniref:Uncharacterized protein n=1 Tax=Roridomyces roridus TaxID=1738132 RepID=A0AAD7BQ88_9AGAR|nr:hypothetical protein FB45DRAFT_1081922 [Roridomyces roridus]
MDCSPVPPLGSETLMSLPVAFLAGSRGQSFENDQEVRFLDYQASYREKHRPPLPCPPYPTDPTVRAREGLPTLFVPGPHPAAAPNPFLCKSVASIKANYGSIPSHQLVAALVDALDDAERTLNFLLQPCTPVARPPALSTHSSPFGALTPRPTPHLFSSTPIGSETFPSTPPICLPSKATSFFLPTSVPATTPLKNSSNTNPPTSSSLSSARTQSSSWCHPNPFSTTSSSSPFGSASISDTGVVTKAAFVPSTAPTSLVNKATSFSPPIFGARPFAPPLLQERSKTNNNPFNIAATSSSARNPSPFSTRDIIPALGVGPSTTPAFNHATPAPRSNIRIDVDTPSVLGKRVESGSPPPSPPRTKPMPHPDPLSLPVSASESTETAAPARDSSSVFQRLLKPAAPCAKPDSYGVDRASDVPAVGPPLVVVDRASFSWPPPAPVVGDGEFQLFGFGCHGDGGGGGTGVARSASASVGGTWARNSQSANQVHQSENGKGSNDVQKWKRSSGSMEEVPMEEVWGRIVSRSEGWYRMARTSVNEATPTTQDLTSGRWAGMGMHADEMAVRDYGSEYRRGVEERAVPSWSGSARVDVDVPTISVMAQRDEWEEEDMVMSEGEEEEEKAEEGPEGGEEEEEEDQLEEDQLELHG